MSAKLNIMLSCGAGMSSGFLAQKTRKAAKKRGLDAKIDARSESQVSSYFSTIDILLLGPHYANQLGEFQAMGKPYDVPVAVIPQKIYATLDGEKLLDFALEEIEKHK